VTDRAKPPRAGMGRPKGSPNKTTAILRDAIIKGAENAGGGDLVAYLTKQAEDHPGPYLTLLGKVLPLNVQGELEHTASDPLTELLEQVAASGRKITDRKHNA
jgi:hypothetical protein